MAEHAVKCHNHDFPCKSGMINPAHIDLFRAVMRYGGMTRAAEALGIGQPHVSRAIAQLEADLGFALFVRGHGSALPTEEGEAFSREVERTYAGLDQLEQAARQIREIGTGVLRVACQPSLASRLVPRAIRQLSSASPDVRVSLHVPSPDTTWSWASTGQCDIGLVRPRSGYAGVECEPFLTVDAVCALPRQHALVRRRTIAVSDLAGVPLIAGAPGVFQQAIEETFARAGIEPRFAFMAQYTAARCGLVAEGLGLAIVDPLPARELTGLPIVLRPFQPRLPIETMLIRPSRRPPGALAARFIELLKAERDAMTPDA
jgi:DNA-binding transcriptional LysR family regulator